jgi:hypothetical protein
VSWTPDSRNIVFTTGSIFHGGAGEELFIISIEGGQVSCILLFQISLAVLVVETRWTRCAKITNYYHHRQQQHQQQQEIFCTTWFFGTPILTPMRPTSKCSCRLRHMALVGPIIFRSLDLVASFAPNPTTNA